jgi:hypothetical protein
MPQCYAVKFVAKWWLTGVYRFHIVLKTPDVKETDDAERRRLSLSNTRRLS